MRLCLLGVLSLVWSGAAANGASTVWAGTDYGVFKSTDGGATWIQSAITPASGLFGSPPVRVNTVVVDPVTPTTIYAFTGTDTQPADSYKSTDDGATWTEMGKPNILLPTGVDEISADAAGAKTMYVRTAGKGGQISTNGGLTWNALNQPNISRIFADPKIAGTVYVIGSGGHPFLRKSTDYGVTWADIATSLPFGDKLYFDPSNNQTWYGVNSQANFGTCPETNDSTYNCALYKSTDSGNSFRGVAFPSKTLSTLAFDATPGVIYAGAIPTSLQPAVLKSTDGGVTWTILKISSVIIASPIVRTDRSTTGLVYSFNTKDRQLMHSSDGGANWVKAQLTPVCYGHNPACDQYTPIYDIVVAPAAQAAPLAPVITAVVNGASFQPGISPNSWVTITGTNLALGQGDWSNSVINGQLPKTLNGASVSIGGKPAYVYYTLPQQQLNVLAPDFTPGPVDVTVTTPGGTSNTITVTGTTSAPAFFLWPGNQVVATRQDYSLAVKPGTLAGAVTIAAKPGDILILWGTGFGPTTPPAPTGIVVPTTDLFSTISLPSVSINNVAATVYGAALAPGAAGLDQVAIQVPASLGDGDWPIVASIGGASSPSGVLLSVHH